MRVFLSSVTYALKAERAALAAILKVSPPYEPIQFEDFVSQDRSSREACLAGVDRCDVFVLLLGPRYGDPVPDSAMSPTEEEYTAATRTGKPVLVFVKETDEADDVRQSDFKRRVEDYIAGRFRGSFRDPLTLNVAVLAALGALRVNAAPLTWQHLAEAPAIRWRWDVPEVTDRGLSGPVFDVHLVPLGGSPILRSRLQQLPRVLARTGRETGFIEEDDALVSGTARDAAWTWVGEQRSPGIGLTERHEPTYRGLIAIASGQVSAFRALPTDFAGALVDRADLQRRAVELLLAAARHLSDDVGPVAIAAGVGPLDRLFEGDPALVTGRHGGPIRMRQGQVAVMTSDLAGDRGVDRPVPGRRGRRDRREPARRHPRRPPVTVDPARNPARQATGRRGAAPSAGEGLLPI